VADYAPVDLSGEGRVEFELNGRRVSAPAGTMLVDAAYALGVEIPIFCYEPRLGAAIGACRQCLVEVEGTRGLQTACSTPVQADMVVRTNSDLARDGQDGVIEMLLENHPLDCPVCDKGGECPLQDRTFRFGPGTSRMVEPKRHFPKPLDLSSLIALDRERCIHCFRCVRFSQDVAEDRALVMENRGAAQWIAPASGDTYTGRFTGNIIDLCPVGALTSIPYRFVARPWDITNTPSVCGHDATGTNVELTGREGRIARVTGRPAPNYAVEEGWLSDLSRFAHTGNDAPDRLRTPIIRDAGRAREASIEDAVDAAALVLRHGGPVGILVGPTATVEEGFLAQELAAGAIPGGALVQRLGIPGDGLEAIRSQPAAELGDLDAADLVVIVGGDPANQQPIVELRVRKARRRGAQIVCVGPRAHALEGLGTAVRALPGGLAAALEALQLPDAPGAIVMWDEADLAAEPDAAAVLARRVAEAGARQIELGADVNGAGLRALGLPAGGVLEALQEGRIDVLVTIKADPLAGPGASEWGWALGRLRGSIAIESHAGGLTDGATVVIPAASHYETEGVYVSMTGRAQRLRAGAPPPGGAAPGWEILVALAHRLGRPPAHRTAAGAFAAAAAARPALAGLDHDAIGAYGAPIARPAPVAPDGAAGPREPAGTGLPLVTTRRIFGTPDAWRAEGLRGVRQPADLTLNPAEAARHGLAAGGSARVRSPHGETTLPVTLDPAQPEGVAFVAAGVPGSGVERLLPPDRGPVRVEVARA
jgi:NADH-quinone oxidoreductase subunit G